MKINYPIKKTTEKKAISSSKRGMNLEEDINLTNEFYLANDIAIIHKKPTPITVVNVDYPMRNKAKITEAYYKTPSTTDYNGVFQGKYIDFEAKETNSTTSFPLKNIHPHQINHLKNITKHNGLGFIIVLFSKLNECYLLTTDVLFPIWDLQDLERKSIPLSTFREKGYKIKVGAFPRLDYLKIVKEHLLENN